MYTPTVKWHLKRTQSFTWKASTPTLFSGYSSLEATNLNDYVLLILVIGAEGLAVPSKSSNVYVKVQIKDISERTKPVKASNLVWNETFKLWGCGCVWDVSIELKMIKCRPFIIHCTSPGQARIAHSLAKAPFRRCWNRRWTTCWLGTG